SSSTASWKAPSRAAPTRVHALHLKPTTPSTMYHKRLMMRAESNGNSKSVSASRRCNGREATARLSNQHASQVCSPDFRRRRVVITDAVVDFHGAAVRLSEVLRSYQSSKIDEFINQRRIPLPDRPA